MKRTNTKPMIVDLDDLDMLKTAIDDIKLSPVISHDLETSGLDPWEPGAYIASIGIGTIKYDWCFPMNHFKSPIYGNRVKQEKLVDTLDDIIKDKFIIGHNHKFDHLFMRVLFGVKWYPSFDTLLADYNLNENKRHGLKEIAIENEWDTKYDIPLKEKQGREGSLKVHCRYLAKDLFYTLKLYFEYSEELKRDKGTYTIFNKITMPALLMYCDAQYQGVYIDKSKLDTAKKYWREKAVTARAELDSLCPSSTKWKNKQTGKMETGVNWGSPQQLAEVLFKREKLKALDYTPKGSPSTSESVLLRLSHKHRIPKLILEYREALKNLNTFIEAWEDKMCKSRIHPNFKIHGTVTGRPSCESPNLQQVPRNPQIRTLITAPPGWTLLDVDYSQAELRIAAEMSQDPTLMLAYQTGVDVHSNTVEVIFGIAKDKQTKEQRKKGKAINFGFLYGMFWKKFKDYARDNYGVEFSDEESKRVWKAFFKTYPSLRKWHECQKAFAHSNGYVRSLLGRVRRLPEAMIEASPEYNPKREEALRQAINSPVQSFASDLTLMSAIEIHRTFPRKYLRIVGSVHDSLLMECRNDKIKLVAPKILKILKRPKLLDELDIHLSVPLEGELEIGPWGGGKIWQQKR